MASTKPKFPGWRTMTAAQRYNAKADALFDAAYEREARKGGWFPTCEAHIMFRQGSGVCRHLKDGETYQPDTDSLMSVPLRHASSWRDACKMDDLLGLRGKP